MIVQEYMYSDNWETLNWQNALTVEVNIGTSLRCELTTHEMKRKERNERNADRRDKKESKVDATKYA